MSDSGISPEPSDALRNGAEAFSQAEPSPNPQPEQDVSPASPDGVSPAPELAQAPEEAPAESAGDAPGPVAEDAESNPTPTQPEVAASGDGTSDRGEQPAEPGGQDAGRGGDEKRPRRRRSDIPWDQPMALVRFGQMAQVGLFGYDVEPPPRRGAHVVIRTDRGVELGLVVSLLSGESDCGYGCTHCERLADMHDQGQANVVYSKSNRILRLASPQDINDQMHLDQSGREKRNYCQAEAAGLGLKMRVINVEHLLGGERVVFYFTAENRVDFRDLVRKLASQYRTRIEMRQIGARDEARLMADYERCGQECCCRRFLGTLQPVSIRMAKTQKATLDPSKISGRCGRLMCCLRYEDETYEKLKKRLPKKKSWVRTADVVGRVLDCDILTQWVRLADPTGAIVVVSVDDIIERNVEPPPPPPLPSERRPSRRDSAGRSSSSSRSQGGATPAPEPQGRDQAQAEPVSQEPALAPGDASPQVAEVVEGAEGDQAQGEGKKKKRRRRRKKPATAAEGSSSGGQAGESAGSAEGQGLSSADGSEGASSQPKKRRRRRRRKPKNAGGGANPGPGGEGGG